MDSSASPAPANNTINPASESAAIVYELGRLVDQEYASLVRAIAQRWLARDAKEGLAESFYINNIKRGLASRPDARSLDEKELDALIRAVIAGVRSRLYKSESLATSTARRISFDRSPGRPPVQSRAILSQFDPRQWVWLLILDPETTRLLLRSLEGLIDSCPTRGKYHRLGPRAPKRADEGRERV
jgi:hypothetical protein